MMDNWLYNLYAGLPRPPRLVGGPPRHPPRPGRRKNGPVRPLDAPTKTKNLTKKTPDVAVFAFHSEIAGRSAAYVESLCERVHTPKTRRRVFSQAWIAAPRDKTGSKNQKARDGYSGNIERRWPPVRCASTGAERRGGGLCADRTYVVIPQAKKKKPRWGPGGIGLGAPRCRPSG
jgi:hypothetical protein